MKTICKNLGCREIFEGEGDFCSPECLESFEDSQPGWKKRKKANRTKNIQKGMKKFFNSSKGEINKKKLSKKMSEDNPMSNDETIEKMKSTKDKRGILHTWLGRQGGNREKTPQQLKLFEALGGEKGDWKLEIVIPTKKKSPYPTSYKVDIGHKLFKIGCEVDGRSHFTNRKKVKEDIKKMDLLTSMGWVILRFQNKEIDSSIEEVLDKINLEMLKFKGIF